MEKVTPYASLKALRDAHSRLRKRRYERGMTTRLLRDIDKFVQRGRLTGMILAADDDRSYAQAVLDYWTNVLYRAHWPEPEATLETYQSSLTQVAA
jgi:hypothetical protein